MAMTRAQQTLMEEMKLHRHFGGSSWSSVATEILAAQEGILAGVVGSTSVENEPALFVTDQRVILAKPRLSGAWKVSKEFAAGDVAGAELTKRMLTNKVTVRSRFGDSLSLKTRDDGHGDRLVTVIRHLVAGGAPPR